jgi:hypothetical protein
MERDDDGMEAWHHHEELLQQQYEIAHSPQVFQRRQEMTMGLVAKDSGGDRKFENAPAGAYVARCFRVVDLGTQTFQVMGETKQAHQCLITWELGKTMEDGKPFTISEKYTVSLHEKAKMRAVLESWRGRKFTEAERKGFDLKNLLGKVCFLNIVHSQRGEKTYANVASVMPVPEGIASPPPTNETLYYAISEHHPEVFERVPKYYREMIAKSPEYQMLELGNSKAPASQEEMDDDIPF